MIKRNTLKRLIPITVLLFLILISDKSFAQADVELRFDSPARHFTQSLPLGNGRLGAMVYGNPNRERIVLNEISMWSGGVEDPNRKDAFKYLPKIQQLLKEEKNEEAQKLLQQHFTSAGKGSGQGGGANVKFGCYQIFSDLFIEWQDTISAVSEYKRKLNLENAIGTTEWKRNGIGYKEEVWVNKPKDVVIVRLTADGKNSLDFDVYLNRKERATSAASGNSITLKGQLNGGDDDKGVLFAGHLKVLTKDGTVVASGDRLKVKGSSECLLLIGAATDMNWPDVQQRGPDPVSVVEKMVDKASRVPAAKLLTSHIDEYQTFFNKCRISFNDGKPAESLTKKTTARRLVDYASGTSDAHLPALYFNFGRYLIISSSRPGGLPANLQGLWAEEYQTPWNGDYHLNINVQMNYWPVEVTNLASLHEPLIEFTKQLVVPGKKTAKAYYDSDGWTAHVISNPWKFTAPGEHAQWGSTLTGGAWLAAHLWKHYAYNPDKNYLSSIYPVLKGSARFYTDILIEDPKTKWLVTAPSNSPENTYITLDNFQGQTTMGPTMDMQIGRELLSNTIKASTILGLDASWRDSLRLIRKRLAPNQISATHGGVQEWLRDYREAEPQHRHVSHLYGLYPYNEINPRQTPELAAAAEKTLQQRGDGGTGWSKAWKISFWARLGKGDRALDMLKGLLLPAFTKNTAYDTGAGTYENLFCAHPPFQIDGNLGATAGIAEMLLQQYGEERVMTFLPALPSHRDWKRGTIRGLRAEDGFQIDLDWDDGKLSNAVIYSHLGNTCRIELPLGLEVYSSKGKKVATQSNNGNLRSFATKTGEKYFIR